MLSTNMKSTIAETPLNWKVQNGITIFTLVSNVDYNILNKFKLILWV